MMVFKWLQFGIGTLFLLLGMIIFILEMYGLFRFKYVLNRMHAAAMGDTLGISISLIGLMVISGFSFFTLKLLLVILFLWFASPVSSHLIARLEVTTNEEIETYCEVEK